MKIGIFTSDFYPIIGGMGTHVYNLTKQLIKNKDCQIKIFSPSKNNIKDHITIFPSSRKLGKNIALTIYLTFFLSRIIKRYSLELMHLHSGNGGIFLLKKPKIPCVVTAHTNSYLCHYKYLHKISKLILSPLEKLTYTYADRVIAVSSLIKQDIIKNYGISANKITVLPNGVDFQKFKKIRDIPKLNNSLVFVGRLDQRKGVKFLIRTLLKTKKKINKIKLFIIGDGPDKKDLIKLTKNLNLEDNVIFTGFLNEKKVAEYYNRCKLTIIPSIVEGFGLNVLESLACKTLVISTKNVGAMEYIPRKLKRLLTVNYNNSAELSNRIVTFLKTKNDEHILQELSEKIRKDCTWEKITKQTVELYKNE